MSDDILDKIEQLAQLAIDIQVWAGEDSDRMCGSPAEYHKILIVAEEIKCKSGVLKMAVKAMRYDESQRGLQ